MRRLNRRYVKMLLENKPQGKVVVAIARELVGFLWATLRANDSCPSRSDPDPNRTEGKKT